MELIVHSFTDSQVDLEVHNPDIKLQSAHTTVGLDKQDMPKHSNLLPLHTMLFSWVKFNNAPL